MNEIRELKRLGAKTYQLADFLEAASKLAEDPSPRRLRRAMRKAKKVLE